MIFFLSETTTYTSEATPHPSEATTHASEATTHASEATTHASEATTMLVRQPPMPVRQPPMPVMFLGDPLAVGTSCSDINTREYPTARNGFKGKSAVVVQHLCVCLCS